MKNVKLFAFWLAVGLSVTRCTGYSENVMTAPDVTPPRVKLYLGTDPVNEPCKVALEGHDHVSSRLLPFNLCAEDPKEGGYTSGLHKVCLKVGTSPEITPPAASDECWKDRADILPLLMLKEGRNSVTAFAKDIVGNMSRDSADVNFNLSIPPKIKILSPTPGQITAAAWAPGSSHTIEFNVSDDDTPAADIKLIVTLVESDNRTTFAHLGCNFANSSLWKQCPLPELERSSRFSPADSSGNVRFNLEVPSDWPVTRKYIVAITAIDRSGNADIGSTQDINVAYEVLAGKTFRGTGGSPTRMQRQGETSNIFVDRKGSLILPAEQVKVDPFDRRTCRFFRATDEEIGPFDCTDSITRSYITGNEWVYDSLRDVFFSYAVRWESNVSVPYIVEISFAERKITPIFGGSGKINLPAIPPAGAKSSDYRTSEPRQRMAFDNSTGRLFFRNAGRLYTIDREYNLKHIAGNGDVSNSTVPAVSGLPLANIALPHQDLSFGVTKDGRIIFSDAAEASWSKASGWSVQYILEAPALQNSSEVANLIRLTPTNVAQLTSATGTHGILRVLNYDPVKNRFYSSIAWWAAAYLNMPPKGAAASEYVWTYLNNHNDSVVGTDNSIFGEGPQAVEFPVKYPVLQTFVAYVSDEYLYTTGATTGSVFSIDIASKTMERQLGFPDAAKDVSELGMNAKVDSPISLCLNGQELYFNDYAGMKKISIDASGNGEHTLKTVMPLFPRFPMRCDFTSNRVHLLARRNINTYNLADLSIAPTVKTDNLGYYSWTGQFGVSNSLTALKRIFTSSTTDTVASIVYRAFVGYAEFTAAATSTGSRMLSISDGFANGVNYCSGPCAQGTLNGGAYDTSAYRMDGYFGQEQRRAQYPRMAFDATDTAVYTCLNNSFVKIVPGTNKVYPFQVKVGTALLSCVSTSGAFVQSGGAIYYSRGNNAASGFGVGIYQIDTSNIEVNNSATATLVTTRSPMPLGVYSDFIVTPQYLYLGDRQTGRIIRSLR